MKLKITEYSQEPIKNYKKSQAIRLLDIGVIAPVTMVAGFNKNLHPLLRASLILISVSTLLSASLSFAVNRRLYLHYLKMRQMNKGKEAEPESKSKSEEKSPDLEPKPQSPLPENPSQK